MVLTELVRWFDGSTKSTIVYVFITIDHRHYIIQFFKSGILLQQPRALLEGVSAHFLNMYCVILNEMRGTGDIRSSWVTAAGPILLRLGRATKMAVFGAIFEISSGHRKSRIYPNQKNVSHKYFK